MKKSYHSIAVPTVDAITALRSCALCSASGNWPTVVAIAMDVSPFLRCAERAVRPPVLRWQRYFGALAKAIANAAIANGSQGTDGPRPACAKSRIAPACYWEGRLDAITVTGLSR